LENPEQLKNQETTQEQLKNNLRRTTQDSRLKISRSVKNQDTVLHGLSMSDRTIPRSTLDRFTSYRTSLLSAIGHIRRIEEEESQEPSLPMPRHSAGIPVPDVEVCEGCNTPGHRFTECVNHPYVWNSALNGRLLQPGERLPGSANWQDIHRASLHHLIGTAVQYYISVHHTHIQDIHALLTDLEANSQFGDISQYAEYGVPGGTPDFPATEETLETGPPGTAPFLTSFPPAEHGTPGIFLINLAVLTTATKLRVDPWCETSGYIQFIALNHWHPSFGIPFVAFLQLVHTELREGLLHQPDHGANPFDIQIGIDN
jgi:hypothetical protein